MFMNRQLRAFCSQAICTSPSETPGRLCLKQKKREPGSR